MAEVAAASDGGEGSCGLLGADLGGQLATSGHPAQPCLPFVHKINLGEVSFCARQDVQGERGVVREDLCREDGS